MTRKIWTFLFAVLFTGVLSAQDSTHYKFLRQIYDFALTESDCYENLRHICKDIGPRLSGSDQAEEAVQYTDSLMRFYEFDRVFKQEVTVPHWVRGKKEQAEISTEIEGIEIQEKLQVCALGGSIGTPDEGVTGRVVKVHDFEELEELGRERIEGKIVFFNKPMPPTCLHTFDAYGKTVGRRYRGAAEAEKYGAAAAVVRSLGLRNDTFPHTGSMKYYDDGGKIPAAAVSVKSANMIAELLDHSDEVTLQLKMSCRSLPDKRSHNVIGELEGSEKPGQFIIAGGHLDSWDLGEGAHDDGAGTVQAIEALRILKELGYKPRHSIRAVLFMNEENGMRGAKKYARLTEEKKEHHIAAVESDRGGFTPRGFSFEGVNEDSDLVAFLKKEFEPFNMLQWEPGYSAPDIRHMDKSKTMLFGYLPDSQRYFDVHHADSDVFETVHKRELELGAAALAGLIYLLDQKQSDQNISN